MVWTLSINMSVIKCRNKKEYLRRCNNKCKNFSFSSLPSERNFSDTILVCTVIYNYGCDNEIHDNVSSCSLSIKFLLRLYYVQEL